MPADLTFSQALSIVQAAGVAGVLTVAVLAFLRGWVVPADVYHRALDDLDDCRRSNDTLRAIIRAQRGAGDDVQGQGSRHIQLHGPIDSRSADNDDSSKHRPGGDPTLT